MSRFFSIASAPDYFQSDLLYERKPVTDLWKKLTTVSKVQWKWRATTNVFLNSKKRVLQVHGPPGTGKSSATFSWVYDVVANAELSVKGLWIDCATTRKNSSWSIYREDQGTAVQVSKMTTVPDDADETAASFHIAVFDGVWKATLENWRGFLNDLARRGVFVIFVSSECVRMHKGDANDILELNHFVSSWTLDEYAAACSSDQFWSDCCVYFEEATEKDDLERRKKLLEEKYYVAGQSVRYMFGLDSDNVKRLIAYDARALSGISALEDAARSDGSSGAVNSLIARSREGSNGTSPRDQARLPTMAEMAPSGATHKDEFRPFSEENDPLEPESEAQLVSAFATERVVKRLPNDVPRLRSVAKALQNKAIEGYALEEQLKKSLNEARKPGASLTTTVDQTTVSLPVSKWNARKMNLNLY